MKSSEAVDRFCRHLESSGRPETSVRNYRYRLSHFFNRQPQGVLEIEPAEIIAYLAEEGLSQSTLYTRYSALRVFYGWLHGEGLILVNPMLKVPQVRHKRNLPKLVMTRGEAEKILQHFPADSSRPIIYRNRLMLELLYTCSLRRSELVALKIVDYTPELRSLQVRQGKTRSMKVVPVGKLAAEMLRVYLEQLRPECDHPELFVSVRGEPLRPNLVTEMVRRAREETKIRTRATSQSFRKTSATQMLRNGAKIEAVQQLLGHTCIHSTQAYTKVEPADLIRMHRARHPREKQKNQRLPELSVPEMLTGKIRNPAFRG